MGVEYNLNEFAQVTLNSSGTGRCFVAPSGVEKWRITRIAVKTNQASSVTTIPVCSIYLDSVDASNLFDATYTGSQDASDCDITLEKNQQLLAEWTGGPTTGVIATLSVFGTRTLY